MNQSTMMNRTTTLQCNLPDRVRVEWILHKLQELAMKYTQSSMEASSQAVQRLFAQFAQRTMLKHELLMNLAAQQPWAKLRDPHAPFNVQHVAQEAGELFRQLQRWSQATIQTALAGEGVVDEAPAELKAEPKNVTPHLEEKREEPPEKKVSKIKKTTETTPAETKTPVTSTSASFS
jgi:hypothetical protein